jgi:hypothetical protein
VLHVLAAQGHLQATHIFKESTALCTLSIVLLQYVVVIINFGVIGCLFFLSYVLRPLCAPLGVCAALLVVCILCCFVYFVLYIFLRYNALQSGRSQPTFQRNIPVGGIVSLFTLKMEAKLRGNATVRRLACSVAWELNFSVFR